VADVLVVDDDLDMAELVKLLLEGEGHQVRLAANGQDGLRELAIALPDLVLLDIEMPVLDGPAMAYRMFVQDLGMDLIPIVVSSGAAFAAGVAREIGTPYGLFKPYGEAALVRMVNKALAERIAPVPKFKVAAF
jgi:CheY-like chemotaxis protein